MDNHTDALNQLRSATNIYIGISNAESELSQLKAEHENHALSARSLQQRTATICRDLETCLKNFKSEFEDSSTDAEQSIQAMINSIHSFQRYMVKKIHGVVL